MPMVTVLTAVRNGSRYLADTIESIRAQSFDDWEYIIVDDASTDDTPGIIQRFASADARIRFVQRQIAAGPFVAANDGLRLSRGKYIVRTDADDISLTQRLSRQIEFLRQNPHILACAAFCQNLNDDGPIPGFFSRAPLSSAVLQWELGLRCNLVHSSACLERSAFTHIGGYAEHPLAQDYRLWCIMSRMDWLAVIPEVLVYFRVHENRVTIKRREEQNRLGVEVTRDHMTALTGDLWTLNDAVALHSVGLASYCRIPHGLRALKRWNRAWRSDRSLSQTHRAELGRISRFRQRKFLRCNARRQPILFLLHLRRYLCP
jgi:glycosyltransferase involved in cell wall biosynthesis